MTAAERYESVWNKFLVRLNQNPQICLSSFQEESHVYKRGMMRWMYAHGLTVREAKKRIREFNSNQNMRNCHHRQIPQVQCFFL